MTGTEWEYEDALRAAQAKGVPDLMVFRNISNAPIDTRNPDARAASFAQLTALDTFWKLHFADRGTFRYAFDEYDTLEQFAERLEETLRKVIERRIAAHAAGTDHAAAPIWLGEPFRGLEPYEFEHAPIFFGRDAQITKATEQLAANAAAGTAFLLVSGASGSGKSSLVKAAVIPRLMKPQRITGAAFVRRVVFRAGAGGADPFLGLAQALIRDGGQEGVGLPELVEAGQDAHELAAHLRGAANNPGYAFGNVLGRLTQAGRAEGKLLAYEEAKLTLVVDQLEELFTIAGISVEDRNQFIALLGGLARSGHVWVVVTLRADFWHRAAEIPALLTLAEGLGRIDVAAPSPAELAEIIRKPATAAGLIFEAHPTTGLGLDVVLAEDAAAAPGVLPLLSFALAELYRDAKARGASVLTHASYQALGGLEGAIAKRAEEVVDSLPDAAKAALPRVLRALATVTAANDHVPVSRSTPLSTFGEGTPARQLVDALIAARLLVADESAAVPTVRLAHEALIGRWQRARDQLTADRRDLETRAEVEDQFKRWREARGSSQLLLRNPDLANGVDLARRWGDEIDPAVRDYVKRSGRRARLAQTLTGVAALVFALVAIAAGFEYVAANHARQEAEAQRARAESTLATAVKYVNNDIFNLAGRFRNVVGVPTFLIKTIIENARELSDTLQAQLAQSGLVTPELRLSQGTALIESVDTLLAIGDTRGAFAAAKRAREIMEALVTDVPNNIDMQHELAVAYGKVGNVQVATGHFDLGLKSYDDELAIMDRLVKVAPKNVEWEEDLALTHDSIGDVRVTQGRLDDALHTYRDSLEIRQRLAKADPNDPSLQNDFSLSYEKVGDVLAAQDHLPDALRSYFNSLAIREKLAKANPDNTLLQRNLSISYLKIGDVQLKQNNQDYASQYYRDALEIRQRLAKSDPGNASWQEDLSVCLDRIGDVQITQGHYSDAFQSYRESLGIRERLAKSDTGNADWQRNLALAYARLGYAYHNTGDRTQALSQVRRGEAIIVALTKLAPNNATWKSDLVWFDKEIDALTR